MYNLKKFFKFKYFKQIVSTYIYLCTYIKPKYVLTLILKVKKFNEIISSYFVFTPFPWGTINYFNMQFYDKRFHLFLM